MMFLAGGRKQSGHIGILQNQMQRKMENNMDSRVCIRPYRDHILTCAIKGTILGYRYLIKSDLLFPDYGPNWKLIWDKL